MRSSVSRRVWPLVLGGLGAAVLAVGLILVFRPTAFYRLVSRLVVVDDRPEQADFIYVLNGRIGARANQAAALYHQGFAPRILLPRTRELAQRPERPLSDVIVAAITTRGVPSRAVSVIPFDGGVVNTRDEGRALRRYLQEYPAQHVIVVTMDYHTGRALRTLAQELRGLDVEISMSAASDPRLFNPGNWWHSRRGRDVYLGELVKLVGTIVQGFVPFR